ncbi:OLC1v1031693C1 [Oldenlandia corymbosa var. corymbosa]|uniref:OLC1v1031693C1 n=1 Tax=Oldenlandia corymbosa var. corymbosa TaxID=529605 RepID=A0AAV1CMA6_OLDCO|nr:OLC1v1031693C1 [Oldenlandia corymbosa var. corymbosa]
MAFSHPIHEANKNSPYGDLTREEFHKKHQILHKQSFMFNKKNMKIFTQSWQPADYSTSELKGLVAMIHGYCSESSWLFELNAIAIAKSGYFVCALDLPGHGYSEGSRGFISDLLSLVSDSIQFFDSVRKEHSGLPAFLYGESLGGAIAVFICLRQKNEWNGLILSGPMFGISRNMLPMWPTEKIILPVASSFAPSWQINSTRLFAVESIKEGWKKRLVGKGPNRPTNSMIPLQAITLREFMKACSFIQRRCHQLEVPLLVLHGEDDRVCEPQAAKFVFQSAASKDKSMKICPGMWHQLIGEPNPSVEQVFEMIISWIEVRAKMVKMNHITHSSL